MDAVDKIIELRKQIFKIQYKHWTAETLFSAKWWFLVIVAIIFWFTWWKLVDKKRFKEIALAGFVSGVVHFFLNTTGMEMTLWAYPVQIFGLVRSWALFELTAEVISYMLLYQYSKSWEKYLMAVVIYGAFSSFIIQPLFVHFGLYKLISWNYLYSFLVFIFIGSVVKFITSKIITIEKGSL